MSDPRLLFFGFAACAFVMAALFAIAWKRMRGLPQAVAALAWLAYGGWEIVVQLLSPEANIRADFLLSIPLLSLATVVAVVHLILRRRREASGPR